MAGEGFYQKGNESGRSEDQIKQDLEKKFQEIDKNGIRDDQEIYNAAKKIVDDYINEIKKSKNESYGPWALEAFSKIQKDILKSSNSLKGMKWTSSNENRIQINDLANKIDDAENLVIQRLALNRTTKLNYDVNEKQKEIGKNYFSRDRNSNIMTFQKDVNKPRIDQVLPALGLKNNEVYRIDYTNCKNQSIKNKMTSMIGGTECTISFNTKTQTYNIKGPNGKIIDAQRAYIYEGVTITNEKVKTFQAQAQLKKEEQLQLQKLQNESKSINSGANFETLLQDKKRGPILKELQATGSKLYDRLQKESSRESGLIRKFLVTTEKRLDGIVIDAKKNNRNLQSEPITKKSRVTGGGLMEVHLIARNGTAEQNIVLFNDEKELGEELYDMIDSSYEEEYMNFLTSRITQKMDSDYSQFTKKEKIIGSTIDKNDTSNPYTIEQKNNVCEGLSSFKSMIQNMKADFGDTWDDDDREMEKMLRHIDNSIYSIENNKVLTENMLVNKIINPLEKYRQEFASYNVAVQSGKEKRSELFSAFKTADKNKIRQSIRSLGNDVTTLGNTHTSHLTDDIIHDKDLVLNDNMDIYFQNISKKLELNENDETKNINQKKLIDTFYTAQDGIGLKKILQTNGFLPGDKQLSSKQIQQVEEKCTQLREQLSKQKEAFSSLPEDVSNDYLTSIKKDFHDKKVQLEAKTDKTEEDYVTLQTYIVMEQNPDILHEYANTALRAMKDQIKYANIDNLVKGTIGAVLIDLSDGVKSGKNANIYNDIKGYGWFNLSDENAKFVGELGKMIIEEIVFTLAVIALTATTGVGGAALVASRVALTAAKTGGALNKIRKAKRMISLARNFSKATKAADKINDASKVLKVADKTSDVARGMKKLTNGTKAVKQIGYIEDVGKAVKQIDNIKDGSHAVQIIDKVNDTNKALQLIKKGEQIVETADKVSDISKLGRFGKISKGVGNYINKLNPLQRKTLFADLDKMLTRGALHQLIAKTYRGQLDDSTSNWITDTLKSSGMYGILGVVGRWSQLGVFGKLAQANPHGLSLTRLAAEEGLMFGSDLSVDIVMETNPMPTMEEIAQNIGIGLGAELLPYIGKIKELRIGKSHSTINGIEYSNSFLLEEINDFKVKEKIISKSSVSSKIDIDINNKKYKSEAHNKIDEDFISEMNTFMNEFGYDNIHEFRTVANSEKAWNKLAKQRPDVYTSENRKKALEYFNKYDILNKKIENESNPNSKIENNSINLDNGQNKKDIISFNIEERSDIAKARAEYESIKKDFDEAKASGIHNDYNLSLLEKNVSEKLNQLNNLIDKPLNNINNGDREVNSIINNNNIESHTKLSFSEYHKDFELFLNNKENFSSSEYKKFLESQFSDIRNQSDLNQKIAYHLIGLSQMRRISNNAHVDYRWGPNDSKNYAKFIQNKIGYQIEDVVLKKYLNDIVDGKMIDYSHMKEIAEHMFRNQDDAGIIGQTFIDNFVGSGKRILEGTKDNPIISIENLINGTQKKTYHKSGIIEEGYFNESGKLDGSLEAKRTNSQGDIQIGIFENGKLINGKTIYKKSRIDDKNINGDTEKSYKPGDKVIIPRSDGSVSEGIILYIDGDGKSLVSRSENGKKYEKRVTKNDLDKVNKNQSGDLGVSSKRSDSENVIIEAYPIIEGEKSSEDIIINGEDYGPNDIQGNSINSDNNYGNQEQQNDYRDQKQQDDDEFINDMIINNAAYDIFLHE